MGIRIIGLATDPGEGKLLLPVIHGDGGIQLIPQLGEGAAAGKLHLQDPGLDGVRDQMPGLLLHLPQGEGGGLQRLGAGDGALQIRHAGHKAGDAGENRGQHGIGGHELVIRPVGSRVGGVCGQGAGDKVVQPVQLGVQGFAGAGQLLQLLRLGQRFVRQEGFDGLPVLPQAVQILPEGFVLKACIQIAQIPPVHIRFHDIQSALSFHQ